MFSKACEYGIRAAVYVAIQSLEKQRASLVDISKNIDSPNAFTAKILQELVRIKIITSMRGPKGGFNISEEKMKITTLGNIVEAIDGNNIIVKCGLGIKICSSVNPCPIHHRWSLMRQELIDIMEQTTMYDMALKTKNGESYLA